MLYKSTVLLLLGCIHFGAFAQVCDPLAAPSGLVSTFAEGIGAQLQWDPVPGSTGVQIKVTSPSGSTVTRRIIGFERDQFLVPDAVLVPGTYTWQVQAACSTVPPYDVTPVSATSTFLVGPAGCPATVTDIDGNVYSTVQIGEQCWMHENLKVEHYQNGDALPTGLSNPAWTAAATGAFSVYNDDASNKAAYGLLYNWYAAADARGLCPTGWQVPTDSAYGQLINFLGGPAVAGGTMKATGTLLAGTGLWEDPNAAASNSSGFTGLPGGFRGFFGDYPELGTHGYWWTRTAPSSNAAWNRRLNTYTSHANRFSANKQNGFSVRCLKD
ncbi:MAG: hypothetical protein GC205_04075 [Bacteroidetes bacterium]|nr:hypothetical protein [Bacteroidota bacterium]